MSVFGNKKLGFGLMRLPKKEKKIDLPAVCELVDRFLENGYTYFDSAYVYEGSEETFREAVVKRYPRERYTIATKMAGWLLNETMTPEKMFQEQLERCGVDWFDFYLLHGLQPTRMKGYNENNCWEFCSRKKNEGKIKHFGFSFHGDPKLLDELLCAHPEVDFVQLQLNYIDWEDQVIYARENYEVCRKHGKPVTVMEPIKGGYLAKLPPELSKHLHEGFPEATDSSYALRYVGSLEGVEMVLSGMNALEQLQDNMKTFDEFVPLSGNEESRIIEVREMLLRSPSIPCTACRYCVKGCPQGINIPEIFKCANQIYTFGEHTRPHKYYEELLTGKETMPASDCVACGQCEEACPQHLEIIEHLRKASGLLDK